MRRPPTHCGSINTRLYLRLANAWQYEVEQHVGMAGLLIERAPAGEVTAAKRLKVQGQRDEVGEESHCRSLAVLAL
jgi:hypothetical protein